MANDPVSEPTPPENSPAPPTDAISAAPAPAASSTSGTSIAAGPAPQVLFTPDASATAPAKAATAKPGEELIGSWLSSHLHRADVPYAALVLGLAFLLGSFAAANSDVWVQLATGRLLSEGDYQFGVDPFAYTTQANNGRPAVPWINHSWLFSWGAYSLYNLDPSGTVLVAVKAVGIVGLGLLLLLMRPANRHRWAGTLIVLLALVVMSPRFELQPVVVSMLFLAATMFILVRAGVFAESAEGAQPGWLWVLPVLFALWVNLDAYFILGPLTLLLCLIGLLVGSALGHKPVVCLRRLSAVLVIGVIACLANPHHYKAVIRMPPEFGYLLLYTGDFWPESMVAGGRAYMGFHSVQSAFSRTICPLTSVYVTDAARGKNVAGIGFFVLFIVVLASFYFCKPARSSTLLARLVPTALFGILALMLARLIPFFAIIGSAVALLNVQEHLARREEQDRASSEEQDLWANMARLATGFLLFGLFFLAWPGWINATVGDFDSQRRVAWGVSENASLKNTVQYLEKMYLDKKLDRCFNLTPDVASYGAWYAPGVSFFLDERFELFDRDARMYNQLRTALIAETPNRPKMNSIPLEWRTEFARHNIDHVTGSGKLSEELTRMAWYGENEFMSIYADGKTFVLAWKEALLKKNLKDPVQDIREQWWHEAFGKAEAGWTASAAPQETDPSFWHLYAVGQRQPPLAAFEAKLLLQYNGIARSPAPTWTMPYLCASHFGNLIQPFGPNLCARFSVILPRDEKENAFSQKSSFWSLERWVLEGRFRLMGRDLGDPAAVIVGLRKIRQATVESPHLAVNYLTLAEAYQSLETMETHWTEGRPRQSDLAVRMNLSNVRRFQFIGALKQYVVLNPQDDAGHFLIANYYYSQMYLDLALFHMRESVKLLENARNPSPELFQEKNRREEKIQEWQQKVSKRLDDLAVRSKDDPPLYKASKAALEQYKEENSEEAGGREFTHPNMGLIGTAQKILREIPPEKMDRDSQRAVLQLSLRFALQTGDLAFLNDVLPNIRDARDLAPLYIEYSFFLNAASGKYEEADKTLQNMLKNDGSLHKAVALGGQRMMVSILSFSKTGPENLAFRFGHDAYLGFANQALASYFIPRADVHLLRAVFALEVGNTVSARKLFKETLDFIGPNMFYFDRPIAERYYQLMQ